MSNEGKMTLEEKVTQRIKSDTLMSLVGDEDAITELVRRAVHEALYQPKRIQKSYGGFDEADSVAVAAARQVAKDAADKVCAAMVKEMLESAEVREELLKAMQATIPAAMMTLCRSGLLDTIASASNAAAMNHSQKAIDFIRSGGLGRG